MLNAKSLKQDTIVITGI